VKTLEQGYETQKELLKGAMFQITPNPNMTSRSGRRLVRKGYERKYRGPAGQKIPPRVKDTRFSPKLGVTLDTEPMRTLQNTTSAHSGGLELGSLEGQIRGDALKFEEIFHRVSGAKLSTLLLSTNMW
jgi:hypothetical protein